MMHEAQCPECSKTAKGKLEVEEKFGFRNNAGYIMVQSWCRNCRKRERREKRLRQ